MESKTGNESKYGEEEKGGGWEHINFDEIDLGDRIGGGGVGIIYNGWWRGEPVALKTLFDNRIGEDLKREYMDELLVMSKVKHSNIVQLLGACMTPPNLCFVMEMCECSLYNLLHVQRVSFSIKEIVTMATDIASAMEYLHALKPVIIHRDLKSHNVLRASNGSLKVCDFGLVKIKNTTAGTPAYMAPELIENKSFNKSVDVYAFGILVWEMFSQEVPFKMLDISEIRSRVLSGERPRLQSWAYGANRLSDLISTSWSQSADDRWSFSTIVDELLEIVEEVPDSRNMEDLQESGGDALDRLVLK